MGGVGCGGGAGAAAAADTLLCTFSGAPPALLLPPRSFITPPGQGFLPRETALHHQEWAVKLVQQALAEAGLTPADISCIAFTKVPGQRAGGQEGR